MAARLWRAFVCAARAACSRAWPARSPCSGRSPLPRWQRLRWAGRARGCSTKAAPPPACPAPRKGCAWPWMRPETRSSAPNPGSPSANWSEQRIDAEHALSSVSCASSGLCVAADTLRTCLRQRQPARRRPRPGARPVPIAKSAITGVSCASASLCAATDTGGEVLVSTNPAASTPQWQPTPLEAHGSLSGITCVETLCAAVSAAGDVAVSTHPAAGGWRVRPIDPSPPTTAVTCAAGGELPGGGRSRPGPCQRRPRRSRRHLERHPGVPGGGPHRRHPVRAAGCA